jgi:ribosomal protein S18 acetylase RimI-like enzyme
MEQFSICPMEPDDIDPICAWLVTVPLWQRYGITVDGITSQFHHAMQQNHRLFTLFIDDDPTPCGFAWCIADGAFNRSPYLRLIGVHPDYYGRGAGTALLQRVENDSQEYADELFLLVSHFNVDAQRFYQQHGYRHVGSIEGYVQPDITEMIYYKKFAKGPTAQEI